MNRTVVITGAARGLGFYLTKTYLAQGDIVYALVRKVSDQLAQMDQKEENLHLIKCDVSSTKDVEAAADWFKQNMDKVDILLSNAGVNMDNRGRDPEPFDQYDFDTMNDTFTINTAGPMRMVKAFDPLLKPGSLAVSISSGAGSIALNEGVEVEYAYRMSKAALNMGMRLFDNTMRSRNRDVRTVLIDPGWMHTEMCGPVAPCDPEENASMIVDVLNRIDEFPKDWLFISYKGEHLPW
jgi:NAD(P)-dependent dehydrogenase (short-subunit alcohol dehydrogenase family)